MDVVSELLLQNKTKRRRLFWELFKLLWLIDNQIRKCVFDLVYFYLHCMSLGQQLNRKGY